METKRQIALRAAALVGLLSTLPQAGLAYGGPGGRGPGPEMFGMGPPPIMHLIRQLDLTDAQRDQVFAILDRYQPTLRKLSFSLGDGREALHGILSQGGFDPSRLEQDAAKQGKAAQDLYLTTARMLSEIGNLLTPAQRAQLERPQSFAGPTSAR